MVVTLVMCVGKPGNNDHSDGDDDNDDSNYGEITGMIVTMMMLMMIIPDSDGDSHDNDDNTGISRHNVLILGFSPCPLRKECCQQHYGHCCQYYCPGEAEVN